MRRYLDGCSIRERGSGGGYLNPASWRQRFPGPHAMLVPMQQECLAHTRITDQNDLQAINQ